MDPDNPETHNNLGNVLEKIDRMDEAVAHCRRAVSLRPDFAEAHNNLGVALNGMGRFAEGDEEFVRAVDLRPDFTEARFNHAVTRLLLGDFAEGWKAYESRFDRADWTHIHPHRYPLPRWRGEPFAGRRLYVHDEQGFGDTIQFMRYLPRVKSLGGTVIFETRPPMIPLLAGLDGVDELVVRPAAAKPAVACDLVVSLMSLAGIFQTGADTVPASIPYLETDGKRTSRWRRVVGEAGFRVGLVWAGSPNHEQDRRRSCALDAFAPLADIPGVHLFGLQKGAGPQNAHAAGILRENLGDGFDDFADTAAAVESLDLVISVDTAVAHLAGAMGKEVWTLLPYIPDWRWGLTGDRSAWYPQMTLFRQQTPGDWAGVMAQVAHILGRRVVEATGGDALSEDAASLDERFKRAARLHRDGRTRAAEALCREILLAGPCHGNTLNLAAILAQGRGATDEALDLMDRAVAAMPENPRMHGNRGRILVKNNDHGAAALAFQRAVDLAPEDTGLAMDLARSLAADGRPGSAESVCRRLIEWDPGHTEALNLLGTVLGRTGRGDEAMGVFDRVLAVDPASADAWTNKGALLHARGRLGPAMDAFDRALASVPEHADARFNRAQVRLLTGDFTRGWADYDARFEKPVWRRLYPGLDPDQRWQGEQVQGSRLFVLDEQGLGDTLQFVRYLPEVKQRCEQVVLCTARPLIPIFETFSGLHAVVAKGEGGAVPGDGDRFVHLLSLPGIFQTTTETIPAPVPYLFADPDLAARWKGRMPGEGLRVGLVWAGNPGHANDGNRSVPFQTLCPLLSLSGIRYFGLQKGEGEDRVSTISGNLQFANLGKDFCDFSDTAAALANLDLVITVDTAVAHLAGAMGIPVWVMLPYVPDWRWMLERSDSPWYPTMRLFRQPAPGDWDSVVRGMTLALGRQVQAWGKIDCLADGQRQKEN